MLDFGRQPGAATQDQEDFYTWTDTVASWFKAMPRPADVYKLDAIPVPYPRSGYKAWFAEPGACPSCTELASRAPIAEDQQFVGADVMEPPLHNRCRCFLIAAPGSKLYPYAPTAEQVRDEMRKLVKEFNKDDSH